MRIRLETHADHAAIYAITQAAFAPMPFSDGNEADCVDRLRADGDLTLSLVAEEGADIVGHVAFSPVFLNDRPGGWYGLGPISVAPHRQKQGIGGALIADGLGRLSEIGAKGCVLIGDPAYYGRFGFVGDGRLTYRDLPVDVVQWRALGSDVPSGVLRYSSGLE
ncbi:MAG: N-acetyltransferase [Pseudomonadota bacterium]